MVNMYLNHFCGFNIKFPRLFLHPVYFKSSWLFGSLAMNCERPEEEEDPDMWIMLVSSLLICCQHISVVCFIRFLQVV